MSFAGCRKFLVGRGMLAQIGVGPHAMLLPFMGCVCSCPLVACLGPVALSLPPPGGLGVLGHGLTLGPGGVLAAGSLFGVCWAQCGVAVMSIPYQ